MAQWGSSILFAVYVYQYIILTICFFSYYTCIMMIIIIVIVYRSPPKIELEELFSTFFSGDLLFYLADV